MKVSLVMTLLNEEGSVGPLLESVLSQTRRPDEIVMVDGGSRDGTVQAIEPFQDRLPLRLVSVPGANISRGRNIAIDQATGELIACTDGGVRLHPEWLSRLVAPFEDQPKTDVAMGFFVSSPRSVFEMAMGATVLPSVEEIRPDSFLPSSRSIAFKKTVWEQVGGYPEWLDYCEDVVFDLELRRRGMRFAWVPEALVYFRPRPTLRSFFLQYYRYARGDGKAHLWPRRHVIRYSSYGAALALVIAGMSSSWWWAVLALGAAAHLLRPYQRLWPHLETLTLRHQMQSLLLVALIRVAGDVAKMLGYPVGLWWRRKRYSLVSS